MESKINSGLHPAGNMVLLKILSVYRVVFQNYSSVHGLQIQQKHSKLRQQGLKLYFREKCVPRGLLLNFKILVTATLVI